MILTLILLVTVLLFSLIFGLLARRYSWIVNLMRTGVIVLACLISGLITKLLIGILSKAILGLLPEGFTLFGDLEAAIPSIGGAIKALPGLIVAPFVFVALFLIFRTILSFVLSGICKNMPFAKTGNKAISVGVGAFNGILIAFVIMMPLCGFSMIGNHINAIKSVPVATVEADDTQATDEQAEPSMLDLLADGMNSISNNPVLTADYYTVGGPLFTWMTTARVTTPTTFTMNLDTELCAVTAASHYGSPALEAYRNGEFDTEDKNNLVKAGDSLLESDMMQQVMSEFICSMATSWRNGDTFMGLDCPDSNDIFDPFMARLYELLAEETPNSVDKDLSTMLNILGDIFASHALDSGEPKTVLAQMGSSGVLTQINAQLDANEHLQPMREELHSLSMRAMASALGARPEDSEQYDALMGNVADVLNGSKDLSADERQATVCSTIQTSFAECGVEVPDDVAANASVKMIDELGDKDEPVTSEEVETYMMEFMVEEA